MSPEDKSKEPVDWAVYIKKTWIKWSILALIAVFLLLFKAIVSIILLTLASALLAIYFYGFTGLLQRYLHLPAKVSLIVSVTLNLLLLVGFFWFAGSRLESQITQLSDTLPSTIQHAQSQLQQSALGSKVLDYINSSGTGGKTSAFVRHFFSSSFGALSDLYLIILITMFFVASPMMYKRGVVHLLPETAKDKGDELLDQLGDVLKKWIKGQIIGFFFIAVFTGLGLWALGLPLVFTLALIAGFLNFVPNFGPIIAVIPATLLGLMQGPTTALLTFGLYTLVQVIQSAVTQPIIQKRMISMPPVLTVVAQVAMGALTGFWGVLLATPIVAIGMTLVQELYVKKQTYHKYPLN
ncbi:AI-2E family transporter [Mucilaginibacter robiniae]|uniref:AI-2E family transporter n=1 Tax=Mucilaginibacter robiniae TaxID=2728022 RepID=A0A7L5DY93_9SPHI|nr:AI-2E family transporter [Mucilaginibacter robiniae]QJD95741.1 AI-2E family transporter [Mucilaginibacter robiniae]